MIEPPKVNVHDNNTVAVKFAAPRDPEDPAKPIKVSQNFLRFTNKSFSVNLYWGRFCDHQWR